VTRDSVRRRREHAEQILRAAIDAAEPGALVRSALHGAAELNAERPIRLLALGKAAAGMAEPLFEQYGDRIRRHLIVLPHGAAGARPVLHGAHPLPDEASEAAGRKVTALLREAGPDELVVALLSGGGSAVVAAPLSGITIREYAGCIDRLLRAGAAITELNIVRRHIDALKGGRMAVLAAPAAVLGLVLSDVVGDAIEVIASGPFSPDATTPADALRVLRHHGVIDDFFSIRRALEAGGAVPLPAVDAERVRVRVVGGNDVAIEGAARRAAELGWTVHRAIDPVTGPARDAGRTLAREALRLQRAGDTPSCIVAGGETTVAVTGHGRGGRNQELVLAACVELEGAAGITVGSIGTDGADGPTSAAGAVGDETSLALAAQAGTDAEMALRDNDSHAFHVHSGGLIVTGPTGTNVVDVQVALIEESADGVAGSLTFRPRP
jgi:glycerate 2-kinase